jgi:hypothetical protein
VTEAWPQPEPLDPAEDLGDAKSSRGTATSATWNTT